MEGGMQIMKKVCFEEMMTVCGGGTYSYSDRCYGTSNTNHKIRHDVTITGTSTVGITQAKINYNNKLATHKANKPNHSHSGQPVAV
jgi:hypothetical protein